MIDIYIFAHILLCSLSIQGCNSVDSSKQEELQYQSIVQLLPERGDEINKIDSVREHQ